MFWAASWVLAVWLPFAAAIAILPTPSPTPPPAPIGLRQADDQWLFGWYTVPADSTYYSADCGLSVGTYCQSGTFGGCQFATVTDPCHPFTACTRGSVLLWAGGAVTCDTGSTCNTDVVYPAITLTGRQTKAIRCLTTPALTYYRKSPEPTASSSSSSSNTVTTSTPPALSQSTSPTTNSTPPAAQGLSTGAKAGIGVGAGVGGATVFGFLLFFLCIPPGKRKQAVADAVQHIKNIHFSGQFFGAPAVAEGGDAPITGGGEYNFNNPGEMGSIGGRLG